jgi:Fe-S-cluster containining protein
METINFRPCGDCAACCEGHLIGNAHGNQFGKGRKCIFLVKQECQIYHERPETCRKYQCMWSQGIFPEWMKPNKTGMMISAEWKDGKQYLRCIEISPKIDYNVYAEIEKFCTENQTYYVKVPYDIRHSQL